MDLSQVMQMMGALKNSGNPMQMLQSMMGNNPQLGQMAQLVQGKSPQELQNMVTNMCKERNVPIEQAQQVASQLGLKF